MHRTYPLLERLSELRPNAEEQQRRDGEASVLVLPGSRASEIRLITCVPSAKRWRAL